MTISQLQPSAPPAPSPLPRSRWRTIAALLAVLSVCVVTRSWVISHSEMIARDGAIYVKMAREWSVQGSQVAAGYDYHVGYSVLLLGVHNVLEWLGVPENLRCWELAGQLVSLISAVAAAIALWFFAARTFNRTVATVGGLLLACSARWLALGSDVVSDVPAVALQLWAMTLGLWALDRLATKPVHAWLLAAAAGLSAGGGYLIRPESLLPLGLVVIVWLAVGLRRRGTRMAAVVASLTALSVAAACVLPYAMSIGTLTRKKHLSDVFLASSGWLHPLQVGQDPVVVHAIHVYLEKLMLGAHPVVLTLACLYVLAFLLRLTPRGRAWLDAWLPVPQKPGAAIIAGMLLVVPVMLVSLYVHVGYISSRHTIPLAVLMSTLAGASVVGLGRLAASLPARSVASVKIAALLIFAMILAGMLRQGLKPLHEGKLMYRQAAEFVGARMQPGQLLLSDDWWLLHYSDAPGEFQDLWAFNQKFLTDRLRLQPKVTYIAFTEQSLGQNLPGMTRWLARERFEPIYRKNGIRIYQFKDTAGPNAQGASASRP